MKEELLKIINHYGVNNQQRKLQEEVFELQEAIIQSEYPYISRSNKNDDINRIEKSHIAEEIADVMVLLEQFILYYDISKDTLYSIFESKIDRTIKRMENNG